MEKTMRLFFRYLKQRCRLFLAAALFLLIFVCTFALYRLPIGAVLYPAALCALIGAVWLFSDFVRVKRMHETLLRIRNRTDLITQALPTDHEIKDEDYQRLLHLLEEESAVCRQEMNRRYDAMTAYYTVWAHQIKTPIASMRLHLQNEDTERSGRLMSDLCRVERYVDMVLTFIRLESDSTDYVFRQIDPDEMIRGVLKKLSSEFIARKLTLVYRPSAVKVVTDEKWLSFVLEQILSNALKYTPSGQITVSVEENLHLRVADTGIGIAAEDLPRIFENGYTGYNGRTDRRASGIGLYLCKRICTDLGHRITAESTVDVGTVIDVDLSQRRTVAE